MTQELALEHPGLLGHVGIRKIDHTFGWSPLDEVEKHVVPAAERIDTSRCVQALLVDMEHHDSSPAAVVIIFALSVTDFARSFVS